MPTTCAVIGFYNRQCRGVYRSFYRIPKGPEERRRRWLAIINRRREDGKPWIPGNGDRVCSDHFMTHKKSEIPTNPDYVPSVLAIVAGEASAGLDCARFERAQRRDSRKKYKDREDEKIALQHQHNLRALNHDHDYGVKGSQEQVTIQEQPRETNGITVNEVGIPVEVGRVIARARLSFDLNNLSVECV